mgnify:CR=1 FL=1
MCSLSVLIPVYNQEDFLEEAISSVLNQSFKDFELVLINDGSTDKTAKIIKSFNDSRVKMHSTSNNGVVSALNYGLRICSTNIIARFDADDIMLPDRLKIQYKFFTENNLILVGSNALIIDSNGNIVRKSNLPLKHNEINSNMLNMAPSIFHPSVMFNKKKIMEYGGYNFNAKYVEDYDLWLFLSKKGRFANINEPLIKYRVHESGISRVKKKQAKLNGLVSLKNHVLNSRRLSKNNSIFFKKTIEDKLFFKIVFKIDSLIWAIKNDNDYFSVKNNILSIPFLLLRKFFMKFYKYFV